MSECTFEQIYSVVYNCNSGVAKTSEGESFQSIEFLEKFGAGEGNRTLDIQLGKLSFYH